MGFDFNKRKRKSIAVDVTEKALTKEHLWFGGRSLSGGKQKRVAEDFYKQSTVSVNSTRETLREASDKIACVRAKSSAAKGEGKIEAAKYVLQKRTRSELKFV